MRSFPIVLANAIIVQLIRLDLTRDEHTDTRFQYRPPSESYDIGKNVQKLQPGLYVYVHASFLVVTNV